VPENQLPVLLPENVKFKPSGDSPLKDVKEFINCRCPNCKSKARRETDTMDTFVDSSWYYLRYLSPKNNAKAFDADTVNKWLPVDQYIGGVEHAILHLLYSRFITKVLYNLGLIGFKEPFARLFTQGMITKNSIKMSKSRGNVVAPDELIEKYGADTMRLYTLFIGPPEKDAEWNDRGVEGAWRFLNRVWRLVDSVTSATLNSSSQDLKRKIHQTIKKVTEDIEGGFYFNTAIASIMELVNETYKCANEIMGSGLEPDPIILKEATETIVLLLAPFTPHICEELWEKLGHKGSIFKASWPKYDPGLIQSETIEIIIQVNSRVRSKIVVALNTAEEEIKRIALADEKAKIWISDNPIKKFILIPNKLVNIVV